MALQKRRWQVHSAVTPKVRLRKQRQDRVHAVCGKMTSGQLPFSGLTAPFATRHSAKPWEPLDFLHHEADRDRAPGHP